MNDVIAGMKLMEEQKCDRDIKTEQKKFTHRSISDGGSYYYMFISDR